MSNTEPLLRGINDGSQASQEGQSKKYVPRCVCSVFALFVTGVIIYCFAYAIMTHFDYLGVPYPTVIMAGEGNATYQLYGYYDYDMPELAVFKGIPYAQPPVGPLRWQPPQNYTFTGVNYNATADSNVCYQMGGGSGIQSEDCLYLNLWTKNINQTTLHPTLVWIYGGSNVFGSVSSYPYLDFWARKYDICLVAMNYRVNVFGYLSLKELSATDSRGMNASGNYGIEDIRMALKWVQQHGEAFGCDPKSVTVFGQSSGATNIFALLSNANNVGLFHRAIALSGSNNITMNLADADRQNRIIVNNTGCNAQPNDTQVAACLRNQSASAIMAATPQTGPNSWTSVDFWPYTMSGAQGAGLVIVDGVTIQKAWASAAGSLVPVDVILESNFYELELFLPMLPPEEQPILSYTPAQYNQYLHDHFVNFTVNGTTGTTGDALAGQYNSSTQANVTKSWYELQSDLGIFCPHVWIAQSAVKRNPSVKYYVSVVQQPPVLGVEIYPSPIQKFTDAIHLWDWMCATGAWNFWVSDDGNIFTGPAFQAGPVGLYSPSGPDLALSATLSGQFYEFMSTGTITNGMQPINAVSDFNTHYNIAVQGSPPPAWTSTTNNSMDWRRGYCDLLTSYQLNYSQYWWIN